MRVRTGGTTPAGAVVARPLTTESALALCAGDGPSSTRPATARRKPAREQGESSDLDRPHVPRSDRPGVMPVTDDRREQHGDQAQRERGAPRLAQPANYRTPRRASSPMMLRYDGSGVDGSSGSGLSAKRAGAESAGAGPGSLASARPAPPADRRASNHDAGRRKDRRGEAARMARPAVPGGDPQHASRRVDDVRFDHSSTPTPRRRDSAPGALLHHRRKTTQP